MVGDVINPQLRSWFSRGKIVDALCGFGEYFIADMMYRNEHDTILAINQLFLWGEEGHMKDAAKGFEDAVAGLLQSGFLNKAFGLMLSYGLCSKEWEVVLPVDEEHINELVAGVVWESALELASNEDLRNLLLAVADVRPSLKSRLGLT